MTPEVITEPLIRWYENNKKTFPWRENVTPYRVWISEIMLQQTRIEAALPYYERFLSVLPEAEDLAACDDDTLLKLWQGLGYYSRAVNLKKAAQIIVERYGGKLPDTVKELRSLPGIGDYTAGAIASIAYGKPEPAVDGNVLRVIMRLTASDEDVMREKTKKRVADMLRGMYPTGRKAALFTEALMELGEVICVPTGDVRCGVCPLSDICEAKKRQLTETLPVRSKPKQRTVEKKTVLVLVCGKTYALRKRGKGLLSGMWELVNLPEHLSEKDVGAFLAEGQTRALCITDIGKAKHVFSHIEWHMTGYEVLCDREDERFIWKTAEEIEEKIALPTAFRHYAEKIK